MRSIPDSGDIHDPFIHPSIFHTNQTTLTGGPRQSELLAGAWPSSNAAREKYVRTNLLLL